ncbi:MAG: terminase small subunit protein [Pseudomonadota bacterium]
MTTSGETTTTTAGRTEPEWLLPLCERIVEGESLRSICRDPEMPSTSIVLREMAKNPYAAEQYARARDAQADWFADELVEIADDKSGDTQRDKLRVDTRKWVASKMKPRRYGERVAQEISGPGGDPVRTQNVTKVEWVTIPPPARSE